MNLIVVSEIVENYGSDGSHSPLNEYIRYIIPLSSSYIHQKTELIIDKERGYLKENIMGIYHPGATSPVNRFLKILEKL
jgi:hypothetical protein